MTGPKVKVPAHLRKLAERATAAGWRISHTGGGHLRWLPPCGPAVFTAATPHRKGHSARNDVAKLARAGLA